MISMLYMSALHMLAAGFIGVVSRFIILFNFSMCIVIYVCITKHVRKHLPINIYYAARVPLYLTYIHTR